MPDQTRSEHGQPSERSCDYCGEGFTPKRASQRFCCTAHRSAAHRQKIEEGTPARCVAGPRRVRDGWSVTVHLPELPTFDVGDELRIKQPPPEIDLPE